MKRLEYIRQLPGMEEADELDGCLLHYGLDKNADGCPKDPFKHYDCITCKNQEATINGKPAPYLFNCPVKPGQTVYIIWGNGIDERIVNEVRFDKDGWYATVEYNHEENVYAVVARPSVWGRQVFLTREEAENGIEAYRAGK